MTLQMNMTGSSRKALVTAISEITGSSAAYQGAPTFAYEVGGYHIDREGTVMGPGTQEFLDALAEKGYINPENGLTYQLDEVNGCQPEIGVPQCGANRDANSSTTEAQMVPSVDDLIIEFPKEGFDERSILNLKKLVASKAALLKKALGTDSLEIVETDSSFQFPWFTTAGTADEAIAYSRLVAGLCQAAKKQQRVNATEKPVENEKFAFRVFLIRLGFVGKDCKAARKLLLRNLEGNSAFKAGRPAKQEV